MDGIPDKFESVSNYKQMMLDNYMEHIKAKLESVELPTNDAKDKTNFYITNTVNLDSSFYKQLTI